MLNTVSFYDVKATVEGGSFYLGMANYPSIITMTNVNT